MSLPGFLIQAAISGDPVHTLSAHEGQKEGRNHAMSPSTNEQMESGHDPISADRTVWQSTAEVECDWPLSARVRGLVPSLD